MDWQGNLFIESAYDNSEKAQSSYSQFIHKETDV